MMKKRIILARILSAAMLLSACSGSVAISDGVLVETEESSVSVEETEASVEEIEVPVVESTGKTVKSFITNEDIDSGISNLRPIAVMIPNNESALPHYNISKASVLYECNVEYNITRLMAIIEDWQNLERIGNVRSTRDYYVYWAMEYDPLLVHYGNIWYADELLARDDVHNINGVVDDGTAFYRVTDENRIFEQTAYTSGQGILKAAAKLGYPITHSEDFSSKQHFFFMPEGSKQTLSEYEESFNVTKLDLKNVYTVDKPWFEFNPEDGLYYRYEYNGPHMDAATNEQLSFENIIIQFTYYEKRPDGQYLIYQCHDATRDGYYLTNGKAIHINWKKLGEFGNTMYFDDNGKNLNINNGKTMICIVQEADRDDVWFE